MAGSELDGKLRENEGRRLWQEFRNSVGATIGSEIVDERLSLPETAILRDAFVARLRSGRDMATVVDTPRLEDVLGPLRVARQRTAVLQVFLLHPLDRTTGAARVSSQAALASPARLLSLLKGDLFITTAGAQDGLALSATTRHLSSSEDRTEYSLALWGIFVR